MITLPQITADDNWSGTSEDPNQPGVEVANRESTMDLDEHRRIVLAAKSLFAGNAQFPAGGGDAWESLRQLRTVFTTTSNQVVRISKGIHQPGVDPHIQLSMGVTIGNEVRNVQFHLNLTAEDRDYDKAGDMRFTWKAVQFTAVRGKVVAAWPTAVARKVKEKNIRRLSISPAQWQVVKDAMDQAKLNTIEKDKKQASKDEVTAFTKAWSAFRPKNHATLKALKAKPAEIQEALLDGGKFTEGTTMISYNKKTKVLTLGTA
jgi:hypothetical protein